MKRLRKPRLIPREKERRRERDKKREAGKEPDIPDRPVPRPVQDVPKQRTPTAGTEKRVEPEEKRAPAVKPETVTHTGGTFQFPPLDLMGPSSPIDQSVDTRMLERKARFLEEKLREFDIRGDVMGFQPGPVITRFEIKPAPGVKISRFVSCQDDLALVMQASRVRVVAPIPGKAAVGIEVPNEEPALVDLRGILEANAFRKSHSKLTLALGLTIDGRPYATDLAQMPHLLVAGATGSGKSVCLNTIIMSILYRADPSDVKLVLIDPKKLELTLYRKLRNHHLTTREDLDEAVVEREKEIYKAQALEEGKPEKVLDKIIEGKLDKFMQEACLLDQEYIRDPDRKIGDLVKEFAGKVGENIVVRRFTRYELGQES